MLAAASGMVNQADYLQAVTEVVHSLIRAYEAQVPVNLSKIKVEISKKHKLAFIPKLVDIIAAVPEDYRAKLLPYIKAKPVRTASGVAVVAVMSKPHRCPHIALTGNVCVYCPGGPDSDFEYSTQSYTGYEPTSMRAIRARYHPYSQTRGRVDQLRRLGHSVDKVEFIVMGGTFMSLDATYKDFFIRNLHDALSGHHSSSVSEAITFSEQSKTKCIGITIETRPDYCLKPHLNEMLSYGCTRIEIGVQSIYEDVARDTNRGHTVAAGDPPSLFPCNIYPHCDRSKSDTRYYSPSSLLFYRFRMYNNRTIYRSPHIVVCNSFQLGKDCGFKVVSHMMPDLPNMGKERDMEGFREYFENPQFRSDGLKIYPCLVIRGTGLYELWKTGHYKNYTPEELVDVVAQILALVPPWTRVYRIQRDIPMPLVTSGTVVHILLLHRNTHCYTLLHTILCG